MCKFLYRNSKNNNKVFKIFKIKILIFKINYKISSSLTMTISNISMLIVTVSYISLITMMISDISPPVRVMIFYISLLTIITFFFETGQ